MKIVVDGATTASSACIFSARMRARWRNYWELP